MAINSDFEILEPLSTSAYGTTYRGVQFSLQRDVAIFEMEPAIRKEAESSARFWDEINFLAQLRDDRLVSVFAIDRERGLIVMELLESNCGQLLQQPLHPTAARSALRQALTGLTRLHEAERVHGDVRPHTLLIDYRRRIKLSFSVGSAISGGLPYHKRHMKYVAPEIVNPALGEFGAPADLYSLGFSIVELMLGPTFDERFPGLDEDEAVNRTVWMRWHADEASVLPSVRELIPGVQTELVTVLDRLLCKKVADRYTSAAEASRDLLCTPDTPLRADDLPAAAPVANRSATPKNSSRGSAGPRRDERRQNRASSFPGDGQAGNTPHAGQHRDRISIENQRNQTPAAASKSDTKKILQIVTASVLFLVAAAIIAISLLPERSNFAMKAVGPIAVVQGSELEQKVELTEKTKPRGKVAYSLSGNVPDGMTIDGATGILRWTPTAESPHTVEVVIEALDSGSPAHSAKQNLSVNVTASSASSTENTNYATIEACTKAIERNQDDAQAYFHRGKLHFAKYESDMAIADYSDAIRIDGKFAAAYAGRGQARQAGMTSKFEAQDALSDLDKAIELDSSIAMAYAARGWAKAKLERPEDAMEDFSKAIDLDANLASAYAGRGARERELGTAHGNRTDDQVQASLDDFAKAINLDPRYSGAYASRGILRARLRQFDHALEDFNKAIDINPKSAIAYMDRGVLQTELRQFDKASTDLDKAIELKPKFARAYMNRGVLERRKGQVEDASADFDKAIELEPEYAPAYVERGSFQVERKQFDKAKLDLNKAIDLSPKLARAYGERGFLRQKLQEFPKALEDYEKAIEISPRYAWAFLGHGDVEELTGEFDKARKDYDKVIELDRKYVVAYTRRAFLKRKNGEFENALEDLNMAIELNALNPAIELQPIIAVAYGRRGQIEKHLKRDDEAARDFAEAARLGSKIDWTRTDLAEHHDAASSTLTPAGHDQTIKFTGEATAKLIPTQRSDGKVTGMVRFATENGGVRIQGTVGGLKPGPHGFHIHVYGDTSSPDGMAAGGHFNPRGRPHGGPSSAQHHLGDLGYFVADEYGNAQADIKVAALELDQIINRSIVVNAAEDDFTAQPAGNPGPRLAVGVIRLGSSTSVDNQQASSSRPRAQSTATTVSPPRTHMPTRGWATLSGRFVYNGPRPAPAAVDISTDQAVCGQHELVQEGLMVDDDGGLANCVIMLTSKEVKVAPSYDETATGKIELDNRNCRFEPHIAVLRTSQQLVIKNSDPIGHNTRIDPLINPSFNPIMAAGGGSLTHSFPFQEALPVHVGCNIHPWMGAWLVIRKDPYAAVSDSAGKFTIIDLPVGSKLDFMLWNEVAGYLKSASFKGGKVDLKGHFKITLKPGENDMGDIKINSFLFKRN